VDDRPSWQRDWQGPRPRLFDSVRHVLAGLVALAHTRLELLTTELSVEVHRAVATLVWVFVAIFFGGLAVVMVTFTLIIAVGEEYRVLVASIAAVLFVAVTVIAALTVRGRVQSHPRLLATSLEELRRDRDALRPSEAPRADEPAP
jgi:uncharacterized membrane protein YqjE